MNSGVRIVWPVLLLLLAVMAAGQQEPATQRDSGKSSAADRERESGDSSSKSTKIDLSAPRDDAKNHPYSAAAVADAKEEADPGADVQEMHPWDPHRAAKNIEVGDFYFKRKNYRAALDRYREALAYKDNDAVANFRMAQCQEKLGNPADARAHYEQYLKILPQGPFAPEARKSLERLQATP